MLRLSEWSQRALRGKSTERKAASGEALRDDQGSVGLQTHATIADILDRYRDQVTPTTRPVDT